MTISGFYYNGKDSSRKTVTAERVDDLLRVTTPQEVIEYPLSSTHITDRIGDSPRIIKFPDGASLESTDHSEIDTLLSSIGRDKVGTVIHKIENKWKYVSIALFFTIMFTLGFIQYGIPAIAHKIAYALPLKTNQLIAQHSLEFLDERLFKDTQLDNTRQQELQEAFQNLTRNLPKGFDYQLHFRSGDSLGANALALPSGSIVMTDELIQLAETDKELHAVLAHELGHVIHRHGLRSLLQSSIISLVVIAITGDFSSLSIGIPTLLVESKYSREFEREADHYAIEMMKKREIEPQHFADILTRLSKSHQMNEDSIVTYISTHPATTDRVRMILAQ